MTHCLTCKIKLPHLVYFVIQKFIENLLALLLELFSKLMLCCVKLSLDCYSALPLCMFLYLYLYLDFCAWICEVRRLCCNVDNGYSTAAYARDREKQVSKRPIGNKGQWYRDCGLDSICTSYTRVTPLMSKDLLLVYCGVSEIKTNLCLCIISNHSMEKKKNTTGCYDS